MKRSSFATLCAAAALPLHAAFPTLQLKPAAVGQFDSPTCVTHAGDGSGRLFIADQRGKILILDDGAVRPVPFLDLSAKLVDERPGFDERGLLGLAFHPDYAMEGAEGEGRFYVFYSAPSPGAPGTAENPVNCRSVISEFRVSATDPDAADPASERVLLSFDKPQFNHNGGQLAFGPADKLLHISTGDGGGSNDNDAGHTGGGAAKPAGGLGNSQDRTNLHGKILRIDPLGTDGPGGQYGIPGDNPFASEGGGVRGEIHAYGLRNPWRFSFDSGPGGTNRLFVADVGQGKFEEVNVVTAGGNYGWRRFEGFGDFDATTPSSGPYVAPVAVYAHPGQAGTTGLTEVGLSVTGGYVYRGSAIPGLVGKYVFGDWSASFASGSGTLLGLEEGPPGVFTLVVPEVVGGNPIGRYIPAFGRDEEGELYVATKTTLAPSTPEPDGSRSGQLFKIVAAPEVVSANFSADRDNTIFSEIPGNSHGAGRLFAGRIASGPGVRRALLRFDTAAIPQGASVLSAEVTLVVDKTIAGSFPFGLHRLTADWGEAGSLSPGEGGEGATAQPGDATWTHAFFGGALWATAGGDFIATASASSPVGTTGSYKWNSAGLAADVQSWADGTEENHGWLLRGDESTTTAKRIHSRESASVASRPKLEVSYRPPLPLTRREIWEGRHFPVGQYIDPGSDADSDRIAALLEYAWDLDPGGKEDLADFWDVRITEDAASVVFRRDPRATDLGYYLETSTDLLEWTEVLVSEAGAAPSGEAFVSETADPANPATRRVTASVPAASSGTSKLFVRLNVRRL